MSVGSSLLSDRVAQSPSAWRDGVAAVLGSVEVRRLDGDILSGDLTSRPLGSLGVSRMTGGPVGIRHTPRPNGREQAGCFQVWLLLQGRAALCQDGRRAEVLAGDLVVCDAGQSYELAFLGVHRAVLVTMPIDSVQVRPVAAAALRARTISGRRGTGALVAPMLAGLAEQLEESDLSWGLHLSMAVTAMLEAMFVEQLGELVPPPGTPQAALLRQVQSFVDRRLGDARLSPEMIASAHNVSARYLQKLFRAHGQTVTGYIRDRRLEACRRDLMDPRLAHRPIGLVASRWGMTSPAYFSRAFKAAYGVTPRQLRAEAGARLYADGQMPGA